MVWQALSWVLRAIWRNCRVLWTCRISVLSSIGGGLFIAATPQTRDLFADLGLSWKWALFFLFAFGWAWIVHWAARHALRMDDWVPDAHIPGGMSAQRRRPDWGPCRGGGRIGRSRSLDPAESGGMLN